MAKSKNDNWLNPDRGIFLAFAFVLLYTASDFLATRPEAVVLNPASAELPEGLKTVRTIDRTADLLAQIEKSSVRPDPFVPVELVGSSKFVVRVPRIRPRPTPNRNRGKKPTGPVTGSASVKLPAKPLPKKEEAPIKNTVEREKEKPFPLKVIGFYDFGGKSPGRRVVVAPISDPGNYFTMGVGDDWNGADENIRLLKVSATAATFERENGRVVVIDKDPLSAYKPLMKDEAMAEEDEEPADGIEELELNKDLLLPAPKTQKKPQTKSKRPYGANARKEGNQTGTVHRNDIYTPKNTDQAKKVEDLLKALKNNKNADIMDQLEDVF